MKAEQRKELETNTLADRMGHVMQRVRSGQRRTFMIYLAIGAAVLVAAFFGYRWYVGDRTKTSLEWLMLYDGAQNHINALVEKPESNAGKAAMLQVAWFRYWDGGIKMLGSDKETGMKNLEAAARMYGAIAEVVKDDPVFEPQALLGRAVAEESRAVEDRSHLDRAKEYYETLTKNEKYEKTAEAKYARQRLEILNDKAKRTELENTYVELQSQKFLDIPNPLPLLPKGQAPRVPGFP